MYNIYDNENNFIQEIKNGQEEKPLAILNLEIEKDVIKQIKLYKNSNPEQISYNFCKENNIDFSLMVHIQNEIESLIQKYFQPTSKELDIKDNTIHKNNYYNNNDLIYNKNNNNNNNNNVLNAENNSYKLNNDSRNNMSNRDEKNNGKLFFYQFLQNEKNKKLKVSYLNKSKSANKFKIKIFNTIDTIKSNCNRKSPFSKVGSYRRNRDNCLTQNFRSNNNNSNIFNRLYNDAKIKRVVYKRPCHNINNNNENKIFQEKRNIIFETINRKTLNKTTIDSNPSYSRAYQIKPNQLLYGECSFQPNLYNYNSNQNRYNTYNLNKLNGKDYSYNLHEFSDDNNFHKKEISLNIQNNKFHYFKKGINSIYNDYINCDLNYNKYKKNTLYEEKYIPLKNKIRYYKNIDENNHNLNNVDSNEMITIEAFNNLFNILSNYDQSQILDKNTININNIDNNSFLILSNIIKDINNNELELYFK